MSKGVFIIAEAGVNHNGDLETAHRLVDAAYESGADAVKFQTFRADSIASPDAPKAVYQDEAVGQELSHYEMLKNLELSEPDHESLLMHCRQKGIMFLSTPFDLKSMDYLVSLGVEIIKIPSGEITNLPFLRKAGGLGKKIIISTGMSTLEEVRAALNELTGEGTPKENITVLHCNTEYPTPFEDVNLKAIITMRDEFHVRVGYSDHTLGIEVAVAAVALGSEVIEKHFTLDKTMKGPDHRASLESHELKQMVTAIRNTEAAMGDGVKRPSPSEIRNIQVARKSIVAARDIRKGEEFTEKNLTVKRPATGISPMMWYKILGTRAKRDFATGGAIEE